MGRAQRPLIARSAYRRLRLARHTRQRAPPPGTPAPSGGEHYFAALPELSRVRRENGNTIISGTAVCLAWRPQSRTDPNLASAHRRSRMSSARGPATARDVLFGGRRARTAAT